MAGHVGKSLHYLVDLHINISDLGGKNTTERRLLLFSPRAITLFNFSILDEHMMHWTIVKVVNCEGEKGIPMIKWSSYVPTLKSISLPIGDTMDIFPCLASCVAILLYSKRNLAVTL